MGLFSVFTKNSGVIEPAKLSEDFDRLLTVEEEIEVGFKLNEDVFIFTNKRLLVVEKIKEGESNICYFSLPYSQVTYFSVESKKSFDAKGILKIWLGGQGTPVLEKEFNKSVDVYEVQKILVGHVMK